MQATHYAQAVISLVKDGRTIAAVLKGLDTVLAARGHVKLKRAILQNVARMLHTGHDRPTLRIARKKDETEYATEIERLMRTYDVEHKPDVVLDETLIGGFQFETGTVRVDRSYRRALAELYRNITA